MKRIITILLLFALMFSTACSGSGANYEKAVACIGKSTEVLRQEIGLPVTMRYYPSTDSVGMTGVLNYQGFTVYTLLEASGEESVVSVVDTTIAESTEAAPETVQVTEAAKPTGAVSNNPDYYKAVGCIGKQLSILQMLIGEPKSTSYASSCLGEGEDGELYYDGFTVFTYRDTDGTETVYDVIIEENP